MLYENEQDREGQEYVRRSLQHHLSSLPLGRVEVTHTPESMHLSHDLNINLSGMWVGVAEVKVRQTVWERVSKTRIPATTQWFRDNGWFFEMPRLEMLKKQFSTAGKWTKTVSLILCTSDWDIFTLTAEQLAQNWSKVRRVNGMGTDDHGDQPNNKAGVIIPLSIMLQLPKETQ